jgi:hypothetical protein
VKWCPQCNFIYEDDQRLCDMDGTELVHYSRPLPENPSPQRASQPAKFSSKVFAIVAISGVVLGFLLLYFLFYVFTPQPPPQNANLSSSKVTTGPQSTPNLVVPTPAASPTLPPGKAPMTNVNALESASRIVRASPAHSLSPTPKREEKKPKSENTNQNKESKLGSILKKTGRVLKKPFKL